MQFEQMTILLSELGGDIYNSIIACNKHLELFDCFHIV